MIKAGAIEKGMYLFYKDAPYLVAEREFVKPGKGAAFVRCKLKNVKTGSVLRETIKTSESVEEANVYDRDGQFLYGDGAAYHFMDIETYEQFEIPASTLDEKGSFLKEGEQYRIVMFDAQPVDIILPTKMVFEVTDSPDAVKGDTVTGATKTVVVDTGLSVQVPIFIKAGDKIRVNTETGEYVERVNE
jgi:elongation factor P